MGAGQVVSDKIDVYPGKKAPTVLDLNVDVINRFLGIDVSYDTMKSILETLNFQVNGDKITAPTFRADITCMNDIAEEIARIYGYNKIASSRIKGETTQGGRTKKQTFELQVEQAMCGMGLDQIQTFSFISPKYYDKIRLAADCTKRTSVVISNPLGEDTSVMRTTALPSILEVVARNRNFKNENVRLFEIATVYIPTEKNALPNENKVITAAMYGDGNFYDMKGVCENLLSLAGIEGVTYVAEADNVSYHPGRCAKLVLGDTVLGVFGQIHPLVAQNYDLDIPVYTAELDFEAIFDRMNDTKLYHPLPKFPATTRDFSFVCEESLEVGTIQTVMKQAGGKLVEDVVLFDIYRGPQIGENKKSVSIRVTLRATDRTLTVEEADKAAGKILTALDKQLGIALRS